MHTGENEQGLRKILDMTRIISIVVLGLHFYYYCYHAFVDWRLTATLFNRILSNISKTGLFKHFYTSKCIALGFLFISLLGARGRKDEKLNFKTAFIYIVTGLSIYFLSWVPLHLLLTETTTAIIYMSVTTLGFILVL